MPGKGRTRIAPTPSGFIHEGNALNFRLTQLAAIELGLELDLRIDDIDSPRIRTEYVEDIFRVLNWLDIFPVSGPKDAEELGAHSQSQNEQYFWQQLEILNDSGADLFVCLCSRPMRVAGICVAGCSGSLSNFQPGKGVIRCRTAGLEQTLWHTHATYHLVNLITDRDLGTSHIVRGEDLSQSSQFHAGLNQLLPGSIGIRYAHHPLILDEVGQKLSKSQGTDRLSLTPDLLELVNLKAKQMLPALLEQF